MTNKTFYQTDLYRLYECEEQNSYADASPQKLQTQRDLGPQLIKASTQKITKARLFLSFLTLNKLTDLYGLYECEEQNSDADASPQKLQKSPPPKKKRETWGHSS
jgi:hypothetical protein